MKLTYAVVFIQDANGWGAYVPDALGCVSRGDTWEEMLEMIDEGLTFHIEGTLEGGDPLPAPRMSIDEAIAYHLELTADDCLSDLGLDFSDAPPTLATRFEFVEIDVRVPEPASSLSEPAREPAPVG
ncbi:MAG: type II toxin-antitoxin system HicB family antitoxin [Acidimicrobiaceae bacterium]|nr:type II toxin-antitoxin system HicB family antitoxin [Acidimicrobiaceae bacterium]